MAITKKPAKDKVVDGFISAAPDSSVASSAEKEQVAISMKIDKALLSEIDAYAKKNGITRSGLFKFASMQYISKN